jgi:hypothetical protein
MTESDDASSVTGDRQQRALAQQERAIEAINAIFSGSDLTEESLRLANEFTDRQTARLSAWLRRPGRGQR